MGPKDMFELAKKKKLAYYSQFMFSLSVKCTPVYSMSVENA